MKHAHAGGFLNIFELQSYNLIPTAEEISKTGSVRVVLLYPG